MRRNMVFISFFLLLLLIFSDALFAQNKNTPQKRAEGQGAYYIGSGDLLQIVTWKEPEFSRENVLVRTDGNISFPLLHDIQAAGLTPFQLAEKIQAGLKEYVDSPYVTVDVTDPQSKKFYILGEVLKTGEFPLNKQLTVLQAIAIAGGFTEWASKKEIVLLRNEKGKEKKYQINTKDIISGKDLSQNFILKPNDTIVVP